VIDSRHGRELPEQLRQAGIPPTNTIVWDNNGIEFVYPRELLSARFGGDGTPTIAGDSVSINSHVITKSDLATYVTNALTGQEALPPELHTKLLVPLERILF